MTTHAQHGKPYNPADAEWADLYEMLCSYCRHHLNCAVIEGMIEMKHGAPWPDGGWVHDRGAGVSCLSYQTKPLAELSRQQLRRIQRMPEDQIPPVCGGCAARKGTDASKSRHTRADFQSAVSSHGKFFCHETGELCGGWCRAIRAKTTEKTPT